MPITVPPAINYPSPLNPVPDITIEPREGRKTISCEIIWGVTDNNGSVSLGCVNFNLQNNATLEYSQIAALVIDNSACGADLEFVFPDTGASIAIPAYAPYSVIPVFSRQTNFYVLTTDTAISGVDATRFQILNYRPAPVTIPTSQHQNVASSSAIDATVNATTALVAAGVSGTLEGASVFANIKENASSVGSWALEDGNSVVLAAGRVGGNASNQTNALAFEGFPLSLRFSNGLNFIVSGSGLAPGSTFSANIYYREP